MSDPVSEALREALVASLLGTTNQTIDLGRADEYGNQLYASISTPSLFTERIKALVHQGIFDDKIAAAVETIDEADLGKLLAPELAKMVSHGLAAKGHYEARDWRTQMKELVAPALAAALTTDEDTLDKLRAMIGREVDRNNIDVTVALTPKEPAT